MYKKKLVFDKAKTVNLHLPTLTITPMKLDSIVIIQKNNIITMILIHETGMRMKNFIA